MVVASRVGFEVYGCNEGVKYSVPQFCVWDNDYGVGGGSQEWLQLSLEELECNKGEQSNRTHNHNYLSVLAESTGL